MTTPLLVVTRQPITEDAEFIELAVPIDCVRSIESSGSRAILRLKDGGFYYVRESFSQITTTYNRLRNEHLMQCRVRVVTTAT